MGKNALKTKKISSSSLRKTISAQEQKIAELQAEISALKKHSDPLPKNEEEIFSVKEILALMPGNIFWKDKEGRCMGCNNNLAKFFGRQSPDEMIGKRNADYMPKEYAENLDCIDQDIMHSKQGRYVEEIVSDLNNQLAYFFTHKIPLFDRAGEVVGILGISLNITEHKKMEKELKIAKEKAEASNRAKSQFLAVMNHELRTPLTGILGLVTILKNGDLSENEIKNSIEDLENCSQNLLSLVNNVLNFSRLEAGKYNSKMMAPAHLNTLINEVLSITSGLAKNKGLELHTQFDQQLSKHILTDAGFLRQILINIVNNAVKFTEKGYVAIHTKVLQQSSKKAKIEIAIHDTGPGIPPEKLGLIFEPFQQLEDTYTRQSSRGGTGLGLAIVKRLTALLHMEINITSKPGKGSTFTLIGEFETTACIQNNSKELTVAPRETPSQEIYLARKKQKLKILLIEDDIIVQRIHKKNVD